MAEDGDDQRVGFSIRLYGSKIPLLVSLGSPVIRFLTENRENRNARLKAYSEEQDRKCVQ